MKKKGEERRGEGRGVKMLHTYRQTDRQTDRHTDTYRPSDEVGCRGAFAPKKSTGMRCENMDEDAIISNKLTVINIQEMVDLPK